MAKLYSSRFHSKLLGCNILSLRFVAMLCILCNASKFVESRGRMMEPVQRSSLWRRGFDAPVNSDDDALNCGGKWRQQHDNNGKCGVCGDPYDTVLRDHEAGGKYATGIISNRYTTNDSSILVAIDITNFLGGYFEFRICPHNSFKTPVQQTCLDRHQLKIEGNKYRYYPSSRGPHHLRVELPKGMSCNHCVLQWKWHTGKDWGICPDGIGRIGCGPQEEYINCADIAIDPATPQDLDLGLNAGFFDFPLNRARQEYTPISKPDISISSVKLPPGGIPLSMETIRNDVIVEPASSEISVNVDTRVNMIESRNEHGASISVFPNRSGESGTAIQPKFEFFNGKHSTATINASTTPANIGAQKDDIVVLPFMGDYVTKEPITNSSSNGGVVTEIHSEVINLRAGNNTEITTTPNPKDVFLDIDKSYLRNLDPSVYSQIAETWTGLNATFSPKTDDGNSTKEIQSTKDSVHASSQLYITTTPGVVYDNFDMIVKEHVPGHIDPTIATAAVFTVIDSGSTSGADVVFDISIASGMSSTSNSSDARNETGRSGFLASRQTRSILRAPDLSIEATTISLNQSLDSENTVQGQGNNESSRVVSGNLQSRTASQNDASNLSIMPGRIFGVPLAQDTGSQQSAKVNDLSKSLPVDAGASQEVNTSSLSASFQNRSTISGSLRDTSSFDRGTQTDLTSANGWFRNVDSTSFKALTMVSDQNSPQSGLANDLLNLPQTEPKETATGYESWVQPTTTVPTITSSEVSTVNEQSNQSQSIRSRIMSIMRQSGSVNKTTTSASYEGFTSKRPITSSQMHPSQNQLQPIFDNLVQALQARNSSLANTSETSQLDKIIYEQLQALQVFILEKILNQHSSRFPNWNTQGVSDSTVVAPGFGPDAWVQPNVSGSQRDPLESTKEKVPVLVENSPVDQGKSQNKILEQTGSETRSNMLQGNTVEVQQQSNKVQQSEVANRGNIKQGIIEGTNFQADNAIFNVKDAGPGQNQEEYLKANAIPSNTNKTVQTGKVASTDLQYLTQPVSRKDFRNVSQGQTEATLDQQTLSTQTGNTVSVINTKQKDIATTPSISASDQRSDSWSGQSDYVVSTEAYQSNTYKPESFGADAWFLPDPLPLTTVPPPTLPRAPSPHWEQNTRGVSNRGNQNSQRSIYPRPDRRTAMHLKSILTQLSPETNPLTIVAGLSPEMLMKAGVNPRIAESGNFGEIITALEHVLGVSLRSRRRGAAVGPEVTDLGGARSAPFDSLSVLGEGGASTMSGMGPHGSFGRDQQSVDGVIGASDMRGNGRFMNPAQRRRQQLRNEVTRRQQLMQEMRLLQDVMQLLGLGPEPLEPGDPGYKPPGRQGLGGQANQASLLDPANVALGAGGASNPLGGGMGMGMSRGQISQMNALMEMIGL